MRDIWKKKSIIKLTLEKEEAYEEEAMNRIAPKEEKALEKWRPLKKRL